MINSQQAAGFALINIFRESGFDARFAGGCVRDDLIGTDPKDIDLCTDATPAQMIDIAKSHNMKFIPTGLDHGTLTFVVSGEQLEVTTLRIDRETDGRHATVEFTTDWKEDAARRDLTINAMMENFEGEIFDWFGGQDDLATSTIKFVGDADERIKEDFLRILRFFRFANKFKRTFNFDPEGLDAISNNLDGLESISAERIWSEVQKILTGKFAKGVLVEMETAGVLAALEVPMTNFNIPNTDCPITALAFNLDTVDDAQAMAEMWKMSNDERKKLVWLVENKNATVFDAEVAMVNKVDASWVRDLGVMTANSDLQMLAVVFRPPVFPVTGQDMLDMGMTPGPEVGVAMNAMKDKWNSSRFTMTKDQLMEK